MLVTNGMQYTNGNSTGALFALDDNLEFYQGTGNVCPFGNTFSPRIFNGIIQYRLVASNPSSTKAATVTTLPTLPLHRTVHGSVCQAYKHALEILSSNSFTQAVIVATIN